MRCFSGITTQNGIVPCGQCMNCRINKGRNWTTRLLLENGAHWEAFKARGWFCTLTYDDENCPEIDGHKTLEKKRFLKWVNNRINRTAPFRYYAIGEYGRLTFRPHYHMAIFPRSDRIIPTILGEWPYGFTSYAPLQGARARYLAQYTTKKLTKGDDPRLKEVMEPEFRTSTRNPPIGYPAVPSLVRKYRTGHGKKIVEERGDVERTIRISGEVYPLPRYILDKVRQELGIPLLHEERLSHPGYERWHKLQEAEYCPDKAKTQERKRSVETKIRSQITTTI